MSLINNMLKDLEKREAVHSNIPNIFLTGNKPSTHPISIKKIMAGSALFSLIILSYLFILLTKSADSTLAKPLVQSTSLTKSAPHFSSSEMSWLKPALITGMSVQVKDNITEITFLLDHPALYHIESDNISGNLSVTLENAQLVAALPTLNYLNSAIEQLSTSAQNGDTIVHFRLFPGSNIKYVNLNTTEKNPELVIAVEYQPTLEQYKTKLPGNRIKTPAIQSILTEQYQSALSEAESGQYQTAINTLNLLLKTDPQFLNARVSLIALLLDQGQIKRAEAIVDNGLILSPEFPSLIELKARILTSRGKITQALNLMQSVSPTINDNPDFHAFIAALYQQLNDDKLAINLYKRLVNINPQNGNWWFGMAVSLEKINEPKQANFAYIKALSEGHLNTESLVYLRSRLKALQGQAYANN